MPKKLNLNKDVENVSFGDLVYGLAYTPVGMAVIGGAALALLTPLAIKLFSKQNLISETPADDADAIIVHTRVEGVVPMVDDLDLLSP